MKVACIGAGVAGLSAAKRLRASGVDVAVFDKGRGAGGRLSTRRAQTSIGEVRFDHGAQFFTARSNGFRAALKSLIEVGAVSEWSPSLVAVDAADDETELQVSPLKAGGDLRYVGTPGMNGMVKAMAEGLNVTWGQRAISIEVRADGKYIAFEDASPEGPFDTVIVAVPAEQAAVLLASSSPALAEEAARAVTAPCWAVMLAFPRPVPVDWDGAEIEGSPLGWIARNASKPGREAVETWVFHATSEWSRANVDAAREDVAAVLLDSFRKITGAGDPVHTAAHRWLYAKTETAAGSAYGWDAERQIATIGDWRTAPRVEAAWESGDALAGFLTD